MIRDPRFELVWSEAVRALEGQAARIDELRARAGVLVTAASIAASFLGAEALLDDNPGVWGNVGISAFILVVVSAGFILWPRAFTFAQSPTRLIDLHIDTDTPNDIDQMTWALSGHLEQFYDENARAQARMAQAIAVGCIALGVEVLAWLLELGG